MPDDATLYRFRLNRRRAADGFGRASADRDNGQSADGGTSSSDSQEGQSEDAGGTPAGSGTEGGSQADPGKADGSAQEDENSVKVPDVNIDKKPVPDNEALSLLKI